MSPTGILTLAAFGLVSSLVLLLWILFAGRKTAVATRLDGIADDGSFGYSGESDHSMTQTPAAGAARLVLSNKEDEQRRLRDRLVQAGLYKENSTAFYVVAKLLLATIPIAMGVIASTAGLITLNQALFFGVLAGGLGTILPGLWLDAKKARRQTEIRRALPDALDVIVVCVEGGLSLPGAIARVSNELKAAHRTLSVEMGIVQREISIGYSTGEAMRRFADRFDLEELRSLSSVILQAERFGASVVNALRVHADSLRLKRRQLAEERAQKASVKLVFPTVLFIFPALFVVIMGPAVFDIARMFEQMMVGR